MVSVVKRSAERCSVRSGLWGMMSSCVQQCDRWRRLSRPHYREHRDGWTASTISPFRTHTGHGVAADVMLTHGYLNNKAVYVEPQLWVGEHSLFIHCLLASTALFSLA